MARRQVTADLGHELSGRPRYELARNRLILAAQHHPSTQNRLLVTKLAFRPIHRLHQCRSSRPCLPVFTCSTLGSWRHNVPQRHQAMQMCQSCTNLYLECYIFGTLTFKQSCNPIPRSEVYPRRTRYLQHSDGRVLCIGDWALVSEVFDMFLILLPFPDNSRRPTRELEMRQLSIGNTLYSPFLASTPATLST